MSLAPIHAATVAQGHYTTVEAVQLKLPGQTINLLTASAVVRLMVGTTLTTFVGSDPELGKIKAAGPVGFSMEATSPVWKLVMSPYSPAGLATLCAPQAQGSVIQYWTCVIDPATGQTINAHRLWKGRLDSATARLGTEGMTVEMDILTPTELLMMENEGERLTVAWQMLHFGQRGLEFSVEAQEQPFWGTDRTSNPTRVTGGGGGGGFTGGGGGGGGGGGFRTDDFVHSWSA